MTTMNRKNAYIVPETEVIIVSTEPFMDVSTQNVYNTETGETEEVITSIDKYDVWNEGDGLDIY